ncbi:heavy metal-associated isoprenylated plant protein 7-like [Mercurialis annua]|uniref:heavy metal-associated isoprenylated plant protein 7-like n=1 Tax=Mercurialis annua TaxID=3986 RepID=UPI002161098C|nr:heavy metal-associated isoprenylated plant protein 7-like [Mercurialis annua]
MGEEEKKPAAEEQKPEEPKKPAEGDKGEKKEEEKKPAADSKPPDEEKKEDKKPDEAKETKDEPPPPPQEIVLKVYMHCEGCARKVRRCLKGFDGVEDVITDCKTSKVVVKGEKADPLKVLARVQRKSHRQVELISPIPKPPSEEEKKAAEEKEKPKPEEKKEEPPAVIIVVLRVYMHCEACAMEIKKRILRMKGVESAEPDLKASQVTVKGVFEPPKLVDYVYKRTGKHAEIVKQEPAEKKGDGEEKGKESKEEKKEDQEADKDKKGGENEDNKEKKDGGGGGDGGAAQGEAKPEDAQTEEVKIMELKRMEYQYNYPPRYAMELYAYPPQMFSDENPNACTVM